LCCALALVFGAGCLTTEASDGGSSETGSAGPHATFLVHVPSAACDEVGVVSIQVRARRVGCEQPVPCTVPANPPDILGDTATCPITDPERLLAVEVDESGRYYVDTIADRTPDDPLYECHGLDMEAEVLVTSVDLEVGAEKELVALGVECPDPG
jgi:hypothetical protein